MESVWTLRIAILVGLSWMLIGVDRLIRGEVEWGLFFLVAGITWFLSGIYKLRGRRAA